ncbi:MAG: hypothetical protein ACRED8_02760, partial [Caulobacteraceae bacterium]
MLLAVGLLATAAIDNLVGISRGIADVLFYGEDLPILVGIVGLIAAFDLSSRIAGRRAVEPAVRCATRRLRQPLAIFWLEKVGPGRGALLLAAACTLVSWFGVRLVFESYPLSMDEFLADFDARVFAHAELAAKVAPAWRGFIAALQPMFVRHTPDGSYWFSGYLPVNAALRAIGLTLKCESLISPLLAGLGVIATWWAARKLWPERKETALCATVLLASSSQLLITAMTPYAMTAHLAFNTLWLCLFLKGGRTGHGLALVVGFLACGIHQLVFHPLFVAPFIVQLWLDRKLRLAMVYTTAYAAFALFWGDYFQLALDVTGAGRTAGAGVGGFAAGAIDLARSFDPRSVGVMAKNLIRFATWQSLLTIPLLVLASAAALRAGGHLRSLILGIVLTLAAMFVLMPDQDDGWG